jgi:hypothetical protein
MAVGLLDRMSEEIAALDEFVIHGEAYADARLPAGQIVENATTVTVRVRRPATMRLTNEGADSGWDLYFHRGSLVLHSFPQNYYARAKAPESIPEGVEHAISELGIDAPLMDLLVANISKELISEASEVRLLGAGLIKGVRHHHIGIRTPEVDIQLWVAHNGRPLPGKIVITSKWEGGAPRFTGFLTWETTPRLSGDWWVFDAPEGAIEVPFIEPDAGER